MGIIDWWNRILAKVRKDDSAHEPVVELKAQEAPEPVPERKTSDEMIVEMAESGLNRGAAEEDRTVSENKDLPGRTSEDLPVYPLNGETDTDPAGEDGEDAGPYRDPDFWEADTDPSVEDMDCEADGNDKEDTE